MPGRLRRGSISKGYAVTLKTTGHTYTTSAFSVIYLTFISAAANAFPIADGRGDLTPSVALEFGHDNNVDKSANNEESDNYINAELALRFTGQTQFSDLSGNYRLVASRYVDSDEVDVDHFLDLGLTRPVSSRHTVDLSANLATDSEDATNASGQTVDADYIDYGAGAALQYGAAESTLQAIGSVDLQNRAYDDTALGTDSTGLTYGGELRWKVRPKTSAVLKLETEQIDYEPELFLSGQRTSGSIGVTWQALSKTTGEVFVGRTQRNYDDTGLDDTSISTAELDVTWNPADFSRLVLSHSRQLRDALDGDGFASIESVSTTLEWNHFLTDILSFTAEAGVTTDDYLQPSNTQNGRTDDIENYALRIQRELSDRSSLQFSVQREDKTSTLANSEYVQDIVFVRYDVTF